MGVRLINASAGTGKTYTVVGEYCGKIGKAWEKRGDSILLTFTNAAAEELRERAKARLENGFGKPRGEMGNLRIGTFDSLCLEIVREYSASSPELLQIFGKFPGRKVFLVENDSAEERIFSEFWEGIDLSRVPKEILPLVSDRELSREVLSIFASRAVIPRKEEIFRAVLGDWEKFSKDARDASVPGVGAKGGPVDNDAIKSYKGWLSDKKHLLPEGSEGAWIPASDKERGKGRGDKAIPERIIEDSFNSPERGEIAEFFSGVYPEYVRFLSGKGILTFEIARLVAFSTLAFSKDARESCSAETLIVDEFQDTDSVQFKICLLLAKGDLVVVGDEKQGIYGWRNAEIENITDFKGRLGRFKGDLLKLDPSIDLSWADTVDSSGRLEENWRSAPEILRLARHSFSSGDWKKETPLPAEDSLPIPKAVPSKRTSDLKGEIGFFKGEKEGENIALLCKKLGLLPGKTAVLARNRETLERIAGEFRALGMPYSIAAKTDAFRSRAGILTLAWLRLLSDETDERALSVLSEEGGLSDIERGEGFSKGLEELRKIGRAGEIPLWVAGAHSLSGEEHSKAILLSETLSGLSSGLGLSIPELALSLEDFVFENAEGDYDYSIGSSAITLSTIHGAKGLEWENVIVAGIKRGVFPSSGGGGGKGRRGEYFFGENSGLVFLKSFSKGGLESANWKGAIVKACSPEREGSTEEERLLYVALTRAKKRLFLSSPSVEEGSFGKYWEFLTAVILERELSQGEFSFLGTLVNKGDFSKEGSGKVEIPGELEKGFSPGPEEMAVTKYAGGQEFPSEDFSGREYPPLEGGDGGAGEEGEGYLTPKEFGTRIHKSAELFVRGNFLLEEDLAGYPEGERERARKAIEAISSFLEGAKKEGCLKILPEVPCRIPLKRENIALRGIIDAVLVYPDKIVVVDYKTSEGKGSREKYFAQISEYLKPVREFFKGKRIEGAIFWTDTGELEKIGQ